MAGEATQVLFSSNDDFGKLTRPMQMAAKLYMEVNRIMHRFGTHFSVASGKSGVFIPFIGPIEAHALAEETGYTLADLPKITSREFTPRAYGIMTRVTEEAELTFEGNWGAMVGSLQGGAMSRLEEQLGTLTFQLPSNNIGDFAHGLNALALVQAETWIRENWKPKNTFGTPKAGESSNVVLTMTAINEIVQNTQMTGNNPIGPLYTTQQPLPDGSTDRVLKKWWVNKIQYTGQNIFRGAHIKINDGPTANTDPASTAAKTGGLNGKSYSTGGALTKMGMAYVYRGNVKSVMKDDPYSDDKIWRMRKRYGFHRYIDMRMVGLKSFGLPAPTETTV